MELVYAKIISDVGNYNIMKLAGWWNRWSTFLLSLKINRSSSYRMDPIAKFASPTSVILPSSADDLQVNRTSVIVFLLQFIFTGATHLGVEFLFFSWGSSDFEICNIRNEGLIELNFCLHKSKFFFNWL